jgi:hypothetical protein
MGLAWKIDSIKLAADRDSGLSGPAMESLLMTLIPANISSLESN